MEFIETRKPVCINSENIKRKGCFEHKNIERTYLFPAGRFTQSFVASLGFKTQDVMFQFPVPEVLISPEMKTLTKR